MQLSCNPHLFPAQTLIRGRGEGDILKSLNRYTQLVSFCCRHNIEVNHGSAKRQKDCRLSSNCKSRPKTPSHRRQLVLRSVNVALTSWTSASSSTPRRRTMDKGIPCPVVITAFEDRTFTLHHQDAAEQLLHHESREDRQGRRRRPGTANGAGKITRAQLARNRQGQDRRYELERYRSRRQPARRHSTLDGRVGRRTKPPGRDT